MDDYDEVAHLDALNDAALSLDGITRLLESLASHDETNREELLALTVVTERFCGVADSLHNETHKVDFKLVNSN